MTRDRIYEYFIEKDNNCAEAMLRALNDEYCLGIPDDSVKLVGGFGGDAGRRAARCAEDVPPSATGSFMRGLMLPRSLNRLWPHLRRNLWSVLVRMPAVSWLRPIKKKIPAVST